jgi:hypothetical protein
MNCACATSFWRKRSRSSGTTPAASAMAAGRDTSSARSSLHEVRQIEDEGREFGSAAGRHVCLAPFGWFRTVADGNEILVNLGLAARSDGSISGGKARTRSTTARRSTNGRRASSWNVTIVRVTKSPIAHDCPSWTKALMNFGSSLGWATTPSAHSRGPDSSSKSRHRYK